ncbi:tryptophan-rich sensory protein [Devosia sp. PTR5]|uniref:Tryptophan-rich sensory protein n=1 Tax=Devosia oryzisoli TaxID=2774138 RepID=A0A927FSB2_9HYPH|nr:TspO/MBR family protein [Devosia oryzisoli]MBD8065096.1 tryptophan-rich sensory protein [Devosia oryzisoli]
MASVTAERHSPGHWIALAVFLVLVIGVGGLIGTQSTPDGWYQALTKPPLNPPNWVFGPVWFTLYVLIAIAGWRIWTIDPKSTAMKLWGAQMLFNWAWSPTWFTAHQPWLAFAILVAMWLSIVGFILASRRHDRIAPWLFVPYLAWVTFAGYLNLSIALLN